jgi:hypothetical protein
MKRTVLVLSLFAASMASAQVAEELVPQKTNNLQDDFVNYLNTQPQTFIMNGSEVSTINYATIKIGTSFYDLQTNASVGRRALLHGDGTVSAVWTKATSTTTGWPNRGSAYNHFDGTNWGIAPSARVENARTGWPTILKKRSGEEFTIAHFSADGGFIMASNGSKGSNTFTSSAVLLDDVSSTDNRVPIWNRSANTGDTIHLMSNYWASTASNVPVVVRMGISSPTTYSRSTDGGNTWDIEHSLLPGYDSVRYSSGGGDTYAITERNGTVAVCIGGIGRDVAIWKSTDGGTNWTHMYADSFTHAPWNGKQFIPEDTSSRVLTNDGSVDVMIDGNGKIHAFWGSMFVADADTFTDGYVFWPATAQLRHWVEGTIASRVCGTLVDMDEDNTVSITSETFNALDASGNIPSALSFAARYGSTSLVTQPSSGSDADGNLYVIYSAPVETAIHDFGANFRDVFISYSTDGGLSWNGPQNVTQQFNNESVFGSMATDVDGFVHMIFQKDLIPGTNLQNNGNSGLHPNDEVDIEYQAIPVSDILNDNIGLINVDETEKEAGIFVVSQNYPNPFIDESNVIIYLQKTSNVELRITDLTGKVVSSENYGQMGPGNHNLSIDGTTLDAGIYFYTLSTSDYEVTKKMKVLR